MQAGSGAACNKAIPASRGRAGDFLEFCHSGADYRAAREYVRLHGFAGLGQVAKLHFKNTQKLQQRGW